MARKLRKNRFEINPQIVARRRNKSGYPSFQTDTRFVEKPGASYFNNTILFEATKLVVFRV
jgi:hypothetical protein